jgi:hypothetical protein
VTWPHSHARRRGRSLADSRLTVNLMISQPARQRKRPDAEPRPPGAARHGLVRSRRPEARPLCTASAGPGSLSGEDVGRGHRPAADRDR